MGTSGRASRWLRFLFKALVFAVAGLALLCALVVLGANLPFARAFIVERTNAALETSFAGKLEIRYLGAVDLRGVRGVDAVLFDAAGRRVIAAQGIDVELPWPKLLWDLLVRDPDPLVVIIDRVDVRHGEVLLVDDGEGVPTIASAFDPRNPDPTPSESTTIVEIRSAHVSHVWTHGKLKDLPWLDVELKDVAGSLRVTDTTLLVVERAELEARGLPQRIDPKGKLQGTAEFGPSTRVDASFDGEVARMAAHLKTKLDGPAVEASLRARAPSEALRALVPSLALRGTTELELTTKGTLVRLPFDLKITSPAGRAEARGVLEPGRTTTGRVHLSGRHVNLTKLLKEGPESELDFELEARARLAGERLSVGYELFVPASHVAGQSLPSLMTTGNLELLSLSALPRVEGRLEANEPGALTMLDYALDGRGTLELTSRSLLDKPPRLRALASGLELEGFLEGQARLELDAQQVEARFDLRRGRLAHPAVTVGGFAASAHLSGPLSNPAVMLRALLRKTTALEQRFETIELRAAGGPERAHVEATLAGERLRTYALKSELLLSPRLVFSDLKLAAAQERDMLGLSVRRVEVGERLVVSGLELKGRGKVRGSFAYGTHLEALELEADGFDVAEALRVLGLATPLHSGRLDLTAGYRERNGARRGFVIGQARDFAFGRVRDATVTFQGKLQDHAVDGSLEAELDRGATASISLEKVSVGRLTLDYELLRSLSGKVRVQGQLDLSELRELFALERGQGTVYVEATLAREQPGDGLPDLEAHVITRGLGFLTQRPVASEILTASAARAAEPFELEGIDIDTRVSLDSKNAKLRASAHSFDEKGDFLRLEGEAALPNDLRAALDPELERLPLKVRARLPERSLSELPSFVPATHLQGSAFFDVTLEGSGAEPALHVNARFRGLRPQRSLVSALSGNLTAKLSREGGEVRFTARATNREVANLRASWEGDASKLLDPSLTESPVRGKARLELTGFPLDAVPQAADLDAKGTITGHIALDDYGTDAKISGKLEASPLAIAQARFERVHFDVNSRTDTLRLNAALRQTQGNLSATLEAKQRFGAQRVPELLAPFKLRFDAKNFRIAGLHAFLPGIVSELDGRLDAHVAGEFGEGQAQVAGSAKLRDGVFQEQTLGQRFQRIDADLKLEPERLKLVRLVARGSSGRLEGTGEMRFSGLTFESIEARLRIDPRHKIPLTFEGVGYGDASGEIDLRYRTATGDAPALLRVKASNVDVILPEFTAHAIQELTPAKDVSIGFHRHDGTFAPLPVQPLERDATGRETPLLVLIELADKVRVRQMNQLDVQLGGEIKLRLAEETEVTGQLQIKSGTLDIQGKLFSIERGVITFNGDDPSNPLVVALARWDAPSEYRVYAEYTGTASDGTLRLSSEPPLTQDQIVSLLMFGSPDGTTGSSTSAASAALGVIGSTATKGINRVLSRFSKLDVDARIDTSSGESRPELVVQISPRVSARVTRALGEPGPGEPPDRTFATLDLRIAGRWSVATRVGDRGASSLDLVWRLRY